MTAADALQVVQYDQVSRTPLSVQTVDESGHPIVIVKADFKDEPIVIRGRLLLRISSTSRRRWSTWSRWKYWRGRKSPEGRRSGSTGRRTGLAEEWQLWMSVKSMQSTGLNYLLNLYF